MPKRHVICTTATHRCKGYRYLKKIIPKYWCCTVYSKRWFGNQIESVFSWWLLGWEIDVGMRVLYCALILRKTFEKLIASAICNFWDLLALLIKFCMRHVANWRIWVWVFWFLSFLLEYAIFSCSYEKTIVGLSVLYAHVRIYSHLPEYL